MKKKTKNLVLLASVLIILLIGYMAIDLFANADTEEIKEDTTFDITEFTTEEISFYSYKNPEYEIGFYVTEEGYTHYKEEAFPVNIENVLTQLKLLGDLKAIQKITSTEKAEYGLDTPQITIYVTLSDGTIRNFAIGDKALFKEAYYLLDEENNQIYFVDADIYDEFSCAWSDLVQKEEFPKITTDQIIEVIIEKDGEVMTQICYEEELESPWEITTSEGTAAGNTSAILNALEAFHSYNVHDVLEYNCNDFSVYGLETPETVVTVHYMALEEGEKETLQFEFGAVTEGGNYYTRINGSSYVYEMSSYYVEKLCEFDIEELKLQEVEQ